jgi:hypothetical protein
LHGPFAKFLKAEGAMYHIEFRVRRLRGKGHPGMSRRSENPDNAEGLLLNSVRRAIPVAPESRPHKGRPENVISSPAQIVKE